MNNEQVIKEMYSEIGNDIALLNNPKVAHLIINDNKVIGLQGVPGLQVDVDELKEGIKVKIVVQQGVKIEKPVHICFGMIHKTGTQNIIMDIEVEDHAEIAILAHCVFPSGSEIIHKMDGKLRLGKHAKYTYLEKHVHGEDGEIKVYPYAEAHLGENAHFTTEFNLIKGRVGFIDIKYEAFCAKNSVLDMNAKISGRDDDIISISEIGHLEEGARGALKTNIAVKDRARSEVYNKLRATGAYARGHVDCKEIILDEAIATATPIVEVLHPKAHVTHEAAIGSIDKKQLETLLARGLDEEQASDMIIQGLLS
ncbi:MAG: SufD family Fe-S cluster assembly protein [Spirochaetes bacterium]|nr:SufD family Fe-S cluster assembly protein [Spirochaetota bacterium]